MSHAQPVTGNTIIKAVRKAQEGRKDDSKKIPVVRGFLEYFPNAIAAVAEVSKFGATKYDWGNWRHVDNGVERYTEALGRHFIAENEIDPESGLAHAAHTAWNAMARLELMLKGPGNDSVSTDNS